MFVTALWNRKRMTSLFSRGINRGGAEAAETTAERADAPGLSQRSLRLCGEASSSSLDSLFDARFKNGKLFVYASYVARCNHFVP